MGADDEEQTQMMADSAEYDQPAPVEPPKKPSFVSSVRERLSEMSAKAKEDRERREAEREGIREAEKEAAARGTMERKEAEKAEKAQKAYERERNKKSFFQTAQGVAGRVAGGVGRIGNASAGLTQRLQPAAQTPQRQRQTAQMFGGMGTSQPSYGGPSREPNYGAAVGHSFGGGVPLFAPPQRQQRMGKSKASLNMVPLMPYTSGGRTSRGRAGKQPPAFSPNFGLGRVGKMPPLFGGMTWEKRKKGGWKF